MRKGTGKKKNGIWGEKIEKEKRRAGILFFKIRELNGV
jgi:hypothetical protein